MRINYLMQFFTILCFFMIFIMPLSQSKTSEYTVCSSLYSCGQIRNIGYPFWGGNRPQFCGHPDFMLSCDPNNNDYPSIHISVSRYSDTKVLGINTSTHRLTIALQRFLRHNPICHIEPMNTINLPPRFRFSTRVSNISLFNGCPSSVLKYQPKSYACQYRNGTNASAFYFGALSENVRMTVKWCMANLTVPVPQREVDELNNGIAPLLSVLRKGFEMEYVVNFTACSTCENSGGRCGSSQSHTSEFVCYCPHGPQHGLCQKPGRNKLFLIVFPASSVMGIGMLMGLVIYFKVRKSSASTNNFGTRERRTDKNFEVFLRNYGSISPKRYTYREIRTMTNNFKEKLGQGGFGVVFKGKLDDARIVAVKLLKKSKGDGGEFMNEVMSIGRTNHVNIVTLLGFCSQGHKRALVYEFMPNGSLEKFISNGKSGEVLPWETLFDISIGIARGLDYLHRGCTTQILHLDIKPHNILLDENFQPKISDFGLARFCPRKESTMSMLETRGTIGYIAPEVFCRTLGGASHKSDVYSYGMMVLEMVGVRKNMLRDDQHSSESYFSRWIYEQLKPAEGPSYDGFINNGEEELQRKMILVSLWCIQTSPSSRPSINRVVEMLEGSLESLQIPPMPHLSSPQSSLDARLGLPLNDVKVNST